MKILGISGSSRRNATTAKLVQEVLNGAKENAEVEFISLGGKKISPCITCLACAKTNVCVLKDDMVTLRDKLIEADAFVFGGNNIYESLNAHTRAFFERFYQFYHNDKNPMKGKPAVAVGVAGGDSNIVVKDIEKYLGFNKMEIIGSVEANGAVPCFSCGMGHTCVVSAAKPCIKDGELDMSMKPSLEKFPEIIETARELGKKLALSR